MHKTVSTTLNYIGSFPTLTSVVTVYISISAFAPLLGIPIRITSFAIWLKVCAITARIKKCKSIINKKKKKHDEIVLLTKTKLNSIEVFILNAWIYSNVSHDEFVLIKNVLKEHNDMKGKTKNFKT